jgi:signal transduction histidine kinase/ligand-binding sensor domain-containing protein/CheY-like chemotaxis protein/HPt (histidine-containing phosphotransfer) domain-containing protein
MQMLALCLLFSAQVGAVNQDSIRFQRYSLEQGLSQQAVFAMLQDRRGFMWFATQEGLNRFDGYQFRTFYHDPDDDNSIAHDAIYSLFEDHRGMIWLGTEGGLDRFNPKDQSVVHFTVDNSNLTSNRINVVFEDARNRLWVGTDGGGLNRLDPATNSFKHYRHSSSDPNSLNHDNVRSIHQDQSEKIWVGTDSGLNLFRSDLDSFDNFKSNPNAPLSLNEDSIRSVYSDSSSRLWLGSYQNGLIRIDQLDQIEKLDNVDSFQTFRENSKDKKSLCHNRVRDVFQDSAGIIWIATDKGLCRWQKKNDFRQFRHDESDRYSVSDNRTLSVFQDQGGVLWLGTFGGLNKWVSSGFELHRRESENLSTLSSNIITSFAESANGDFWVGTYDGLNQYSQTENNFKQIKSDSDDETGLSDNRIMSLFSGADNTLWIGTRGNGVDHYDPVSEQFTHYRHQENVASSLSGNGITSILEDSKGLLWIAAYKEGLNLLDRESGTFTHWRHDPKDPQTLSSNRIVTLYETRDGLLWIGTEGGGLNSFDRQSNTVTRYQHRTNDSSSLSNNVAWSILEDELGDLWIATWGGGLNRWTASDRQAGVERFIHYGKKTGLVSNIIYDIVADPDGYLWLSTNLGLDRLDPKTGKVKHFDVSHGLQDNEFNHNAATITANGQLFFGGSNGFNAFYADQVGVNQNKPSVELTSVQILNQEKGDGRHLLNQPVLEFGYQDYVVAFEFSGLDYTAPEKNHYQYKLEGFDKEWIDMGTTRRTTFTNLPDGNYVFRVKAANNDGVWSETGLTQAIKVTPPPWRTWWAYSLYGLFFLVLISMYLREQAQKLREKARYSRHLEKQVSLRTNELTAANDSLELARKEAEAGNRSKGAFISTISHELRTPMTTIIGYAESLVDDRVNRKEQQRRGNKIIRSAKHLLDIMNNVLDISKIEVNRIETEIIPLNPVVLLNEVDELIGQQARDKQLVFAIDYQLPLPSMIESDPTRLKQILINLCSNAIKFTQQGEIRITVYANPKSNNLHFSIADTGIGIAADKVGKVFEAFSQADSSTTRKFGGTGLGLSISRQLAIVLGGEMSLDSELGNGSQFNFFVDMGNASRANWLNRNEQLTGSFELDNNKSVECPRLEGSVLLAEDWIDNQELIRMIIERTGAKVTLVEDGKIAVEKALAGSFDLVLMDIQMPEVDGIEATQILRGAGFSKPIIALTADVSESDIDHYLDSGFDGCLGKPIERRFFYRTLVKYLSPRSSKNMQDIAVSPQKNQEERRLTNRFVERLPEIIRQIDDANNAKDWSSLAGLLHNLKGVGGSVGFSEISSFAESMNKSLQRKDQLDLRRSMPQLKKIVSESLLSLSDNSDKTPIVK